MAEKTNIWDGNLHDGKWISGTTLNTKAGTIYVVIPLAEGHEYLVEVFVSADRYRWATFASDPKNTSNNGIRSIYSNDGATAGTQFSFTANAGENYLMGYVGHSSAGANSVTIGVFDMSVPDFDSKYLIRIGTTLYTIESGTLTALAETEITASLFQTYGVDEIPDGALLVGLTDPEVLYWQDSMDELPDITLTVKGTPPLPQMFTSEPMDLTHESIAGISHAAVDASEDVRFAISFDGGTTWKAHDGSAWFDTSDTVPGMLPSTMNAITAEQWAEVVVLDSYMVRFWMPNVTAYVKSVVMHYINP